MSSIKIYSRTLALTLAIIAATARAATPAPVSSSAALNSATQNSDAPTSEAPAPAVEVKIDNFSFAPGTITVKAGTQVTWVNKDDIPHTVDSTEGKFKSPALDTDDKFQFRFTQPGEYPFYCRIHPKMTGKIIVQ